MATSIAATISAQDQAENERRKSMEQKLSNVCTGIVTGFLLLLGVSLLIYVLFDNLRSWIKKLAAV
jgi:hypothetical protein